MEFIGLIAFMGFLIWCASIVLTVIADTFKLPSLDDFALALMGIGIAVFGTCFIIGAVFYVGKMLM